jgi:hypothetical protein
MGDKQNQPFQISFNAPLKVDFQGSRINPGARLVKLARYYFFSWRRAICLDRRSPGLWGG